MFYKWKDANLGVTSKNIDTSMYNHGMNLSTKDTQMFYCNYTFVVLTGHVFCYLPGNNLTKQKPLIACWQRGTHTSELDVKHTFELLPRSETIKR